jgi:uncharacterized damage-inducible protein DinB
MQDYFCRLFRYDKWANTILLDIFDHKPATHPRMNELLSHILSAQRIWLDRCLGLHATAERFEPRTPAIMRKDLEAYHHEWTGFIRSPQAAGFSNSVSYTNFQGDHLNSIISDVITQVTNHGTHHRGTIIALMKADGYTPPNLDYISFTRVNQ